MSEDRSWRLWRHKTGLELHTGRKVEVEVWVPASAFVRIVGDIPRLCWKGANWGPLAPTHELPILTPKNAGYETENRPPEISTPGGTIPARALLELYEEVNE